MEEDILSQLGIKLSLISDGVVGMRTGLSTIDNGLLMRENGLSLVADGFSSVDAGNLKIEIGEIFREGSTDLMALWRVPITSILDFYQPSPSIRRILDFIRESVASGRGVFILGGEIGVTFGLPIKRAGVAGIGGSLATGIAFDTSGNWAFIDSLSSSGGALLPSVSAGLFFSFIDAPQITNIGGRSVENGVSLTFKGINVGVQSTFSPPPEVEGEIWGMFNEGFHGFILSAGVDTSKLNVDASAQVTYTTVTDSEQRFWIALMLLAPLMIPIISAIRFAINIAENR